MIPGEILPPIYSLSALIKSTVKQLPKSKTRQFLSLFEQEAATTPATLSCLSVFGVL